MQLVDVFLAGMKQDRQFTNANDLVVMGALQFHIAVIHQ
jgi:hypothetical protein